MKRKRDEFENDNNSLIKEEEEEVEVNVKSESEFEKCLDSPKITEICKQFFRRSNSFLIKEFIYRKVFEKSTTNFTKIQQEINKMFKQDRLMMYNFIQVSAYRVTKNEMTNDSKFSLKFMMKPIVGKENLYLSKLISNCETYAEYEYYAFFKQINAFTLKHVDKLFNKIQIKEVHRLIKAVEEKFDPLYVKYDIRYLSECNIIVDKSLLEELVNSGNELFKEYIERKSKILLELNFLDAIVSEYEYMIEKRRLVIPIFASILKIKSTVRGDEFYNISYSKIVNVNGFKIDINKKTTITLDLDVFALYNFLKPMHDYLVNSLEGKADDEYVNKVNDLYIKLMEIIDGEADEV